jgi:hypothetical protein
MNEKEIEVISQLYHAEMASFKRIAKVMQIAALTLCLPFILYEFYTNQSATKPVEYSFTKGALIFMVVVYCIIFITYKVVLHPYYLDYKQQQKIVEQVEITGKHEVPNQGLYVLSCRHMKFPSISVTPDMYTYYNIGDEINLEYAYQTKTFFSYF